MGDQGKKFWKIRNEADMEQAEMLLYGEIANETWWGDEVTPKDFAADLSALGGKDLLLRINSPGGDVFAATAIYNQLKDYKGKVTAKIDGMCASAATIVACGADTVTMPANAVYMIHNPAVGLRGFFDGGTLAHMSTYLSTVKDTIILDYQQKVGDSLSKTKLSHMMDNETWMSAQEALEAGFVDSIEDMQIESRMEGQLLNMAGVAMNLEKFKNTAHLHEILTKNVAMPATKEGKTVEDKTILQKIKDLLNGTQESEQEKPDAAAQERERMLALDKLKTGNAFVDSIVETAKKQGQTAEEIKPYLDAMPKSDSNADAEDTKVLEAIKALVSDQMNSGAGNVQASAPKPDDDAAKKKAAIDDVVNFANQMGGARK